MHSDYGSSNSARIRIFPLKLKARSQEFHSTEQNCSRSDTFDFSSSSNQESRHPDATDSLESRPNLHRTRSQGASKKAPDLTTSPPAGKIDTVSFEEDFSWTPSDSDIDDDSMILAENGYFHDSPSFAPKLPYVPTEKHENGRNDEMTGAVGLLDTPLAEDSCMENNFMYCPSLWDATAEIPLKVLRKRDLEQMDHLALQEKESWNNLPDRFCITIIGLVAAILDLQQLGDENAEPVPDAWVLYALARRGGICQDDVVYPEDIKPLVGAFNPDFDELFWTTMWAQAS